MLITGELKIAFGGRYDVSHPLIMANRHAHCTAKGFKNRLGNMVGIAAFQIVYVQRHTGMIHKALKKFTE